MGRRRRKRFDICALVKRGGGTPASQIIVGNGEVQVYFEGAGRFCKRQEVELLFCGKLALSDMELSRVKRVVRRDGLVLPEFAKDPKLYKKAMERVARANGLLKSRVPAAEKICDDCVENDSGRKMPIASGDQRAYNLERKCMAPN